MGRWPWYHSAILHPAMTTARISSRQNALVARYRRVSRGDDATLVLLDGAHLIGEALAAGVALRDVLVTDEASARAEIGVLLERLRRARVDTVAATSAVVAAASPVRTPSGIVALADRPRDRDNEIFTGSGALALVACDVQDPGNLGAMIRAAEAAGATGVVVGGESADPFGWKALRGSMGSALRLPIARCASLTEAVADARRHGCVIAATVPRDGRSIYDADLTKPIAILIGGEGAGVPDGILDSADERLSIPMATPVESLNTAAAAAVVLFEARRQRAISTPRST